MIPSSNSILSEEVKVEKQPSKSYKMHIGDEYINGICTDLEELKQNIYKILNSERYKYNIYSWNYGVEFADLRGKRTSYICAVLERRIAEALMQDDRITSVTDFEFDTSKKKEIACTFTVHTIFGDLAETKVVNI